MLLRKVCNAAYTTGAPKDKANIYIYIYMDTVAHSTVGSAEVAEGQTLLQVSWILFSGCWLVWY